jgi:hypothetical protein
MAPVQKNEASQREGKAPLLLLLLKKWKWKVAPERNLLLVRLKD